VLIVEGVMSNGGHITDLEGELSRNCGVGENVSKDVRSQQVSTHFGIGA
jgi:hypothetical protein